MSNLADILEIQMLKARYCAAADLSPTDPEMSARMFEDIFTDDVVGDYGMGELVGPAMKEFLNTVISANAIWMWHAISSPIVSSDGAKGKGDWTVLVKKRSQGVDEISTVIGRYSDEFVKTPKGWRISRVGFSRVS